jgi:hypothetical protein
MTADQFCTPGWLAESAKVYRSNPDAQKKMKKLSADI